MAATLAEGSTWRHESSGRLPKSDAGYISISLDCRLYGLSKGFSKNTSIGNVGVKSWPLLPLRSSQLSGIGIFLTMMCSAQF